MNRKYCDGCGKELKIYNTVMPDKYKMIEISTPQLQPRDIKDGKYEICKECFDKIIPYILQSKMEGVLSK